MPRSSHASAGLPGPERRDSSFVSLCPSDVFHSQEFHKPFKLNVTIHFIKSKQNIQVEVLYQFNT